MIQTAAQYIAALDKDEDVPQLKSFLKKELVEVTPNVFHGKTWEQRSQRKIHVKIIIKTGQ